MRLTPNSPGSIPLPDFVEQALRLHRVGSHPPREPTLFIFYNKICYNKDMNIKQALKNYSKKINKYSSSPQLDAEILLAFILKTNKEYLYAHSEEKLTPRQINKFHELIKKRIKGEPVAYLINSQKFYGLDFYVNKTVLIPRPETELLVNEALSYIKQHKVNSLADIGTGSGAVIISIAKNTNLKNYFGTDICKRALKVADLNTKNLGAKTKIKFLQGDLLLPLKNKKIDIITANLPYLDDKEKNLLPSSDTRSLKFEPKKALYGGPHGLKFFRSFFFQLENLKLKPKAIFLEIGYNQAKEIKKLAPKGYKIKIKKDLCGFDRVFGLTR